jgi:hypothetical protein
LNRNAEIAIFAFYATVCCRSGSGALRSAWWEETDVLVNPLEKQVVRRSLELFGIAGKLVALSPAAQRRSIERSLEKDAGVVRLHRHPSEEE